MADSLAPLLDRIDRVVVVTLAHAAERQSVIERMFADMGLPFQFHLGRDCRHSSMEDLAESGEYDPEARRSTGRPDLTAGEIGCALSHRDVQRSVRPGERVLILEDDVRVIPQHLRNLEADIAMMPERWALAYFGHALMNLFTPMSVRLKLLTYYPLAHLLGKQSKNPATIKRLYRRSLNSRWMHAGWFNETHAYAIDFVAASYLTSLQSRIHLEADVALNHLVRYSGLTAITQKEILFEQDRAIPSEIGGRPSWH